MKASETTLQGIIEGTKQYMIPLFQRTYSWKEKQWNQLWEDITNLVEEEEEDISHFLGSIVSIPDNPTTHGVQQFLVIDGQQRMTTLLILLAALRDQAFINEANLANEIHNTLLVNQYKSGEEKYKFLPTQVDKVDFKKIVNREDLDNIDDSLVVKGYHHFTKLLADSEIDLRTLMNTITKNLSIVSIILDRDDNPYLVFESLNAKGQPLTQADLIRNYIFMRIPTGDQEDYYKRYWLPMQEELEDNNLTEFIRHLLLGINMNVRKNDVYINFKEKADRQEIKSYLKEIASMAGNYAKLLYPSNEKDQKINHYLDRINSFEAKTAYPFLLYVYRDYKYNKYDSEQFCEILQTIENFLVRRFVCDIDSKPLNKMFASLYNQISTYDAEESINQLKGFLQNRGYPKDSEVRTFLNVTPLYGQGDRRKKGAFILKVIESSYFHKEPANLSKATMEHIMPQTLTDSWVKQLGEEYETIHSTYLHTIGNLTLSAYNTELSNESFNVKKKYYNDSNLRLNKDICEFEIWTEKSIIKRADYLIDRFLEIWPYFGSPENEMQKITGSVPRLLFILEKAYPVTSWRDVLERTIMSIYGDDLKKYEIIMDKNPGLISKESTTMRKAKKLPNGHFVEVNLGAKAIHNFCVKIMEQAGYNKESWQIEVEQR